MEKFKADANTRWAAYSVLAHEIGHHLNYHDFGEKDMRKRKGCELEADRFSGSILRMLDATLDEAQAGLKTIEMEGETASHPSIALRMEAVATGWKKKDEQLQSTSGVNRFADSDGDGVPDLRDACPDTYGTHTSGCPDADEDGIPNRDDKCPFEKGLLAYKGCPDPTLADRDGDTVPDKTDDCPDQKGEKRYAGCPDTDGDGVPDNVDKCKNEKGLASKEGCPEAAPQLSGSSQLLGSSMPDNMVFVQGGLFQMGSNESDDEKPIHNVTLSSFYLSKYEVTNAEFAKFLNEKGNQSEGGTTWIDLAGKYDDEHCRISQSGSSFNVESGYEHYPVIFVSWYGATAYCKWLAAKTGKNYRLPTEAEWEYAAANGSRHTKYSWGDDLPSGKKGGNVSDQSAKKKYSGWTAFDNFDDGYVYSAPVGQYHANDFGLHDMTGNVWEWCSDWYGSDYYKNSPSKDPKGPSTGDYRVCRGGAWYTDPEGVRAAYRPGNNSLNRNYFLGFRPARD